MRDVHGPCIAADDGHCLAALLFGAVCCPDGDCPLCEHDQEHMRRAGFAEQAVARAWLRSRMPQETLCPICGFPPPSPLEHVPVLPHLEREDRTHSGSWACRTCGRPLPRRRRHYCSHACWREHVRASDMDGNEIVSPTPARAYRVRLG